MITYIDLFAGAGGLSEGFLKAGFSPIAHVENDIAACFTLKTRAAFQYLKDNNKLEKYVEYLEGKIDRKTLYDLIPSFIFEKIINHSISIDNNKDIFNKIDSLKAVSQEIDIIIGGPPCQAYSMPGRGRDKNGMKDDPRNYLYKGYANFLKKYNPKIFLFENVDGLLSAKYDLTKPENQVEMNNENRQKGSYLKNMLKLFRRIGYTVDFRILNAKDLGVLQDRNRVIIIGWKKDLDFKFPSFEKITHPYFISDLFQDLPKLKAGSGKDKGWKYSKHNSGYLSEFNIRNGIDVLAQHICRPNVERDLKIYELAVKKWNQKQERLKYNELDEKLITHNNVATHLDRYKVVAANLKFSHTVVAHIAKDGHYYIHPDINQNRSLSIREAARIQSFPDDYYFEGVKDNKNRTASFKQIGNAVPPTMAYEIAKKIKSFFT